MGHENMYKETIKDNWKTLLLELKEREQLFIQLFNISENKEKDLDLGFSKTEVARKYDLRLSTLSYQLQIKDEILKEMLTIIVAKSVPELTNPILN